MGSCTCRKPAASPNPRSLGSCVKCGRRLDPAWASNDEEFRAFFQRLREAIPPADRDRLDEFISMAYARELDGRTRYGFRYLNRDNCVEGFEEAADGGNYAYMERLRARRLLGYDSDEVNGYLLEAAADFASAYRKLASARNALAVALGNQRKRM